MSQKDQQNEFTLFYDQLKHVSLETNNAIDKLLPVIGSSSDRLVDAMRYISLGGGKCFRPFLFFSSANIFSVPLSQVINICAAIEMVHCYSLVHDDLPAMDDDNVRRGKPSCHIAYDEATAILSGDALLTYAFNIIASCNNISNIQQRINLIISLSEASGLNGMVGGQMMDLLSNQIQLTKREILKIKELKTSRLIASSCEMGGIVGNASEEELIALKNYGRDIGIAYQIIDDLFDVDVNESSKENESTLSTSLVLYSGAEEARKIAENLVKNAINSIEIFGSKAALLNEAAKFVLYRKN